ncbi:MAG: ABC transporter ATP-binding protein, partial [Fusobacterium sp.]|nr:ABC transporter ATP-binding protein [Fusobacterium sp.]
KATQNIQEQKRNKNRISSLEKKILKAEADVEKLEEKKSAKEEEYNKAGIENNVDKLIEIQKELEELDMEILSLMGEWEELENELKTLKNTF